MVQPLNTHWCLTVGFLQTLSWACLHGPQEGSTPQVSNTFIGKPKRCLDALSAPVFKSDPLAIMDPRFKTRNRSLCVCNATQENSGAQQMMSSSLLYGHENAMKKWNV